VLDRLLIGCDHAETVKLLEEFRTIVGSIVVVAEPLASETLAKPLEISHKTIDSRLDALHSVLDIPADPHKPVRLLHLSFRDFLVDPRIEVRPEFWVDAHQSHSFLTKKCLELLETPSVLKQNMCELDSPGTLRSEIDAMRIQKYLHREVQYACRYWVYHLVNTKSNNLWDLAYTFLKSKFLYWLEAMSLMGRSVDSLMIIDLLQKNVSVSRIYYNRNRILTGVRAG
jgi:hypothetical protein